MTSFCEEDIGNNLKSSVYNQTGENYFQQLLAYDAMSSHLRRVLQAKSVVDTRNTRYTCNRDYTCRTNYRSRSLERDLSLSIIDKLAYDTEHHPCDILRMNENVKRKCVKESHDPQQNCYDSYTAHCSRSQISTNRTYSDDGKKYTNYTSSSKKTSRQPLSNGKPMTYWSERHRKCFEEPDYSKQIKFSNPKRDTLKSQKQASHHPVSKKCKYEDEQICHTCASSFEFSSNESRPRTPKLNITNASSMVSPKQHIKGKIQKNNERVIEKSQIRKVTNERKEEEEETKYIKFVYDITKEIMQHGLYTDEEIKNVFKKHIEKNKRTLNKCKMQQEIHRLKISLNLVNESDDDEDEDFLPRNCFSTLLGAKPPTPPKVLNENKVVEKLQNYKKPVQRNCTTASISNKSVVLIDANPELLVTEQDVLSTLLEMNLDPKQAQSICKSLYYKSRDTSAETSTSKCSNNLPNVSLVTRKDQVIQTQIQDPNPNVVYPKKQMQCDCKTKPVLSQPAQTQAVRNAIDKNVDCALIHKTDQSSNTAKEIWPVNHQTDSERDSNSHSNLNESEQLHTILINNDQLKTAGYSKALKVLPEKKGSVKINETNEIFDRSVSKLIQQKLNVSKCDKTSTEADQIIEDPEETSISSIVESIQGKLDINDNTVNKISTSDVEQIETAQDSNIKGVTNGNNTNAIPKDVEPEVDTLQNEKQSVPVGQDLTKEHDSNSETNLAPIWESDEESDLEVNEVSSAKNQRQDTFLKRASMKHYFLNLKMSNDLKKRDVISTSSSTISENSTASVDSNVRLRHQETLPENVESSSKICSNCFKKLGRKLKRLKKNI